MVVSFFYVKCTCLQELLGDVFSVMWITFKLILFFLKFEAKQREDKMEKNWKNNLGMKVELFSFFQPFKVKKGTHRLYEGILILKVSLFKSNFKFVIWNLISSFMNIKSLRFQDFEVRKLQLAFPTTSQNCQTL